MKLEAALFGVTLAMAVVVALVWFTPEITAPNDVDAPVAIGHGVAHDTYATMQSGGDSQARHEEVLWLGWAFGTLICVFFLLCLAIGGRKNGRMGPIKKYLWAGGIVYCLVFLGMVLSYRASLGRDEIEYVGNLPAPTAWMLYALWGFPAVFILLYIFRFDRWIYTEEDQRAVDAMMKQKANG